MYTKSEFIEMIDNLAPEEIQVRIVSEVKTLPESKSNLDWIEVSNVIEKTRVATIKDRISKTHTWHKAKSSSNNNRTDVFWCSECNIRASNFEHVSNLSIISKVQDNLPTYTPHNQYLMLTCEMVKELKRNKDDDFCMECGISEKGKTSDCCF